MQYHARSAVALALALFASPLAVRAQEPAAEKSPAEQVEAVKAEFTKAMKEFQEAYKAAKDDDARKKVAETYPKGEEYAARIKPIVDQHPKDAFVPDAIVWVLNQNGGDEQLLDVLQQHHFASDKIADACKALLYGRVMNSERFLRAVMQKSEQAEAKGWATYVLAKRLQSDSNLARRLHDKPDEAMLDRFKQSYGEAKVAEMQKADAGALQQQAEKLFDTVAAECDGIKAYGKTLAQTAKADLYEMRNLAVGKVAPEIEGTDVDGVAFKLSDYRGKVIFLDFWGFW